MTSWIRTRQGMLIASLGGLAFLSLVVLFLLLAFQASDDRSVPVVVSDPRDHAPSLTLTKARVPAAPDAFLADPTPGLTIDGAPSPGPVPEQDLPEAETTPRDLPFLYEIHRERIMTLSPEQQDSLLRVHEEFVEFYRSNPSSFYDEDSWNRQISGLREKAVNAIGIDAFEGLIR